MNYRVIQPLKLNGIRYSVGDLIPDEEIDNAPGLESGDLINQEMIEDSGESMNRDQAEEFHKKASFAESKASSLPNITDLEWREAVDVVMELKSTQTLHKLLTRELGRSPSPRKSVERAIRNQLKLQNS